VQSNSLCIVWFILDNVFLVHETIDWAKKSTQPLVFFKVDFAKAYDKVSWVFFCLRP